MTQSTNTDTQQILERFDRLDQKIEKLTEDFASFREDTKVDLATVKTQINALDKRLDNLETTVKEQDKRFWTLIVGTFLALFGLLAKMSFFPKI
jgi:predicted RNase H-like nuclease (RuvC/YqgF family)